MTYLISVLAPGVTAVHAGTPSWPWETAAGADAVAYQNVAYGNGLWVAVASSGTNRVMTSTDPTCTPSAPAVSCWTPVDVGTDVSWYSVTYGEGIFVAVGVGSYVNGGYVTTEKLAMTSHDGINWTRRETPPSRSSGSPWWVAVKHANGQFVAVATRQESTGRFGVMTSPDGITWTERATPAFTGCDETASQGGSCNQWSALAHGNGTWVAVSTDATNVNNQIMKSTDDGATWTYITGHAARSWRSVIFVDGTFIAMSKGNADNHALVSTDDGSTWAVRKTRTGGADRLASDGATIMSIVTNGAGIQSDHVALGTLVSGCTSSNCWTDNSSIFFPVPNWTEITFGAGIFLMVNQTGTNRVAYTTTPYSPIRELEVVLIDPNDGESGVTYLSGSTTRALDLPTPTRAGYVFTGWNTEPDGSGTAYADGDDYAFDPSAAETTTLYAQWTTSDGDGDGGNLPETGTNSGLSGALLALLIGTGTVLAMRRRLASR